MGGIGSGRRLHPCAKQTTDDYRSIDIRAWKRRGLLESGCSFYWRWYLQGTEAGKIRVCTSEDRVTVTYNHKKPDTDWETLSYAIQFDWTDCNAGGQRSWFLCPAPGCGKRAAILYGGRVFTCRECNQLAYRSQREDSGERAARLANRVRKKLDWPQGIFNAKGPKPKGMHWRTFDRLNNRHDELVEYSIAHMAIKFNLLGESLEKWI